MAVADTRGEGLGDGDGDGGAGGALACEIILENQPISALVAQIFDGKLDKPVAYRIQVRVGQNDKFNFAQFRDNQERFAVLIEVVNISTFRNRPVIDLLLKGNGRNVIQALMEIPKFSKGPYWLASEPAKGNEKPLSRKIPAVAMSQWYSAAQNRDRVIAQAVKPEISKPVMVLTSYHQPSFAVYQLKYFKIENPKKILADMTVIRENFPSQPGRIEKLEREIAGYQADKKTQVVKATEMSGVKGSDILNHASSERRAVIVIPREDIDLDESAQRRLIIIPL